MSCGYRTLAAEDVVQGATIPVGVMYPAAGEERVKRFGPYELSVARDAEPVGTGLPVVVISHGNGGSPWTYRELAKHVAMAGFVVAMPEHIGNSRSDNSLERTAQNLANRPRHIGLAIDAVKSDAALGRVADVERVAVMGHSIGAYTALAVAGGRPWVAGADGVVHPVDVDRDARVKALVLLMPATFWFPPEGLRGVDVPVLMRTGERDEITPTEVHARAVIDGVADGARVEHKVIAGAGHFGVMSKFPAGMARVDFPPSQDPEGFDREAIQGELFGDVVEFLERVLRG